MILGGGGHAKVLIDTLKLQNMEILGIVDPVIEKGTKVSGISVLGDGPTVFAHPPDSVKLVNALGSIRSTENRKRLFERFQKKGYSFSEVIHPSAILAPDVHLGEGVQIMAGVVIQTGCTIGTNAICNSRASIDHECQIGQHVHLAPGVTLSGEVTIDNGAHVGVGSTVIQGVKIGKNSLVGAGSVVIQDIAEEATVFGVPARARQLSN